MAKKKRKVKEKKAKAALEQAVSAVASFKIGEPTRALPAPEPAKTK